MAEPDRGTRALAAYKGLKGAAQVVLAAGLGLGDALGVAPELQHAASLLGQHTTSAAAGWLARTVQAAATPEELGWVALALAVDGGLSAFEGRALHQGRWWAPWLIVGEFAVLLPFEIAELARAWSLARLGLLMVNLGVVTWLGVHAGRGRAT